MHLLQVLLSTLPLYFSVSGQLGLFGDSQQNDFRGQQVYDTSNNPKRVISHYMVGNTYTYSKTDWMQDIRLASSRGLDGFALNAGSDPWQYHRVYDAYSAAAESGTNFKLFISLDMSSFPCSSNNDISAIQRFVFSFATHSAQFMYKSKALVSTFWGDQCTFGRNDANEGWLAALKDPSNVRGYLYSPIYFKPSFFVDPARFHKFSSIDGAFNWNSGWPVDGNDISYQPDRYYISNLGKRSYMPAVSPWFFTHYGPDTYNKNWIYRGDNWLFVTRWEILISHRNDFDLVEQISWNDFGESHYLSSKGEKPMSQAWTDGFDHLGWLDLMEYYIVAFKTGSYPIPSRDRLFLWARLYPNRADCNDRVGKPMNWESTQDILWAIAAASGPSQVTLACGSSRSTVSIGAGLSKLHIPLHEDCQVQAQLSRDKETVIDTQPEGFKFSTHPSTYNYNAFVYATP